MQDDMLVFTIGDREVVLTGWQATVAALVLLVMPWGVGMVTIVRAAMYGW